MTALCFYSLQDFDELNSFFSIGLVTVLTLNPKVKYFKKHFNYDFLTALKENKK